MALVGIGRRPVNVRLQHLVREELRMQREDGLGELLGLRGRRRQHERPDCLWFLQQIVKVNVQPERLDACGGVLVLLKLSAHGVFSFLVFWSVSLIQEKNWELPDFQSESPSM